MEEKELDVVIHARTGVQVWGGAACEEARQVIQALMVLGKSWNDRWHRCGDCGAWSKQ